MNINTPPARYTIHSQMRQRDLATIFQATDNSSGLPVFIALLTDLAATDRIVLAALRSELPLLQSADPALITVLEYNLVTAPFYVVVEGLNGFNLRQLVDTAGRGLQATEALAYCAEAARCVAAIHRRGAVHGAIHIDDFVLRGINMVCVSAWVSEVFGADLFATTDIYASREPLDRHIYQPPELAAHMGQSPTVAGDIYGLGVLLYHMLSGVPPGVAPGSPELAAWLRGGQSPPLDDTIADATLRSRLQKFIQVSTSRDPMRRWPDLKTFIMGLEQINPSGTMALPRIVTTARSSISPAPNLSLADISLDPAAYPDPLRNSFAVSSQDNLRSVPGQAQEPLVQPLATGTTPQQPESLPVFPSPRLETGPLQPQELSQSRAKASENEHGNGISASTAPQVPVEPPTPLRVAQPLISNVEQQPSNLAHMSTHDGAVHQYQSPQLQVPEPRPQPQLQPRTAYLVSLLTGAVYPVSAPRVSLGVARATNFFPDINLAMEPSTQAQFVSQHHLDLFYDKGQWYVQPNSSSRNPTFLNGSQVPSGTAPPIYEDMILEIPALPLRFSFSVM